MPHTEESRRKIGDFHRGKPLSEEHRKKLSDSKKGILNPQYGKPMSEKLRKILHAVHVGRKCSVETKKKMSKSTKLTFVSDSAGRLKSLISECSKGEKSHFWKGGVCQDKEHMREERKKHRHNRRARMAKAVGSFTVGEWETLKRQYGYKCPMCGQKEPLIQLTIDHVIPLAKGGENNISNIQPLCLMCNERKAIKIFRISKKGELMLF